MTSGKKQPSSSLPTRYGCRIPVGGPSGDLRELWEDGVRLSDATLTFAGEYEREQWRKTFDETGQITRMLLMHIDLFAKIQEHELFAIGIREGSHPYEGPEIVPADLFDSSIDSVRSVFADTSRLTLAGRTWVRVKITERQWIPPKPEELPEGQAVTIERKRMGRPSKAKLIRAILREMLADGYDLAAANQKVVCLEVRERAKRKQHDIKSGFSDPVIKSNIRLIRDERR